MDGRTTASLHLVSHCDVQALSRIIVGLGKMTKQTATLKQAFTSFLEDGVRFAFGQVEPTGLAALYYVDVLDEYLPRLDRPMLANFTQFVRKQADEHGRWW